MQRQKNIIIGPLSTIVLLVLLVVLVEFSPINDYIHNVKSISLPQSTQDQLATSVSANVGDMSKLDQQLIEQIRIQAERVYEAPIDAKVDPVWQAIPGYNGLEVDIERTYNWNVRHRTDNESIVLLYREIEPKIGLEDLGVYPIYRGNGNKKMVALMINVAWGDEYLPSMLETLQDEDVEATFFFDGSWLHKNLDTARQICEAGHECSNHAYSHKNMSELSREKALTEIERTEQLLKQKLGIHNRWFAPPSGDYDQETVEVADELGLRTILWTIDTVDWKKPQPEWIIRRVASALEPGSLILMHPTPASSQALRQMIRHIKDEGYKLGTVSEVLSSERISNIEEAFDF